MIPMKNLIKMEIPDDTENVTDTLFVENSMGSSVWFTVEEKHRSIIIENTERIIKFETDILDNCTYESTIETVKGVSSQNGLFSPLNCQEAFDSLITSNLINTIDADINHEKTFLCHICGILFVNDICLKEHLKEHIPEEGNSSINIKKNNHVTFKNSSVGINLANGNNSAVPHNLIMMNSTENVNKETSSCTNVTEVNSDVIELVNSDHINVKNSNKSTVQTVLFSCRYCTRVFLTKGTHTNHEKSHTSTRRQSKNRNSSKFLNTPHNRKPNDTHLIKKRLWYVCDVCYKKFSTPFQLITHRKLHCIEPYVCTICDKSYNFRCHWNNHLKDHYMKNKQKKIEK